MSDFLRRIQAAGRRFKERLRGRAGASSVDESQASAVQLPAAASEPPPIPPEDLARIQQLGRLRAIEPFEGWRHLEAVRKTMTSIEQGVDRALDWGRGMRDTLKDQSAVQKAGGWLSKQKTKITSGSGAGRSEKILKPARNFASKTYRDAGEWLRTSGMENVQQTLEYLLAHDPARWVRGRAAKILERPELKDVRNAEAAFAAMRELEPEEREALIAALYPYDLPGFAPFMKAVDLTVNLGLGAVVATNLPGTGSLVHLINMIKTIFKIAHRLHMMSTVHGAAIRDPNALFVVSAKILQSLQSWEGAGEHRPLDPQILAELYAEPAAAPVSGKSDDDSSGLPALLGASLKKDLYISVPGVGTVGIGKIGLDDARLDYYIRAFVGAYFENLSLGRKYGAGRVAGRTTEFAAIYRAFHEREYFPSVRRRYKARDEHLRETAQAADAAESGTARGGERSAGEDSSASATAAAAIGHGLNTAREKIGQLFGRVSRGYAAIAKDEYFEELSENLDRQTALIYRRREAAWEVSGAGEQSGAAEHPRWTEGDVALLREVDDALGE